MTPNPHVEYVYHDIIYKRTQADISGNCQKFAELTQLLQSYYQTYKTQLDGIILNEEQRQIDVRGK